MERKHISARLGKALALTLLLVLTTAVRADETINVCATETAALQTDSAVQGALNDMRESISTAVQEDFFQFCSILQRSCTVDLSDYADTLPTACEEAGGQIANQTAPIGLDCTGKVLGVPIPGGVEVRFENLPTCVGPNCDPDNLPSLVEDTVQQLLTQEVQPVIEDNLQDGNCTALGSSATTRTPWMVVSLAVGGWITLWWLSGLW
mmetsp:Transcript_7988/g.15246  ORF Transcript_7988/g.15246 Transcript_7988/m.15246 type:complete len:207 (+) Transcript_7988:78-698(+)